MTALEYRAAPDNWRDQAACRDSDPELWFPVSEAIVHDDVIQAAFSVCAGCPVRAQCLQWALDHDEQGIWGGTTGAQRTPMRNGPKQRRKPGPEPTAPCQTTAARG